MMSKSGVIMKRRNQEKSLGGVNAVSCFHYCLTPLVIHLKNILVHLLPLCLDMKA